MPEFALIGSAADAAAGRSHSSRSRCGLLDMVEVKVGRGAKGAREADESDGEEGHDEVADEELHFSRCSSNFGIPW